MKHKFLLACLIILLSGCSTIQKEEPVSIETAVVQIQTENAIFEIVKATMLAETTSSKPTPIPTRKPTKKPSTSNQSSQSSSDTSWFEGGNLHKAKLKAWRQASYANRLATSADFIAATQKVDYGNLAEFKSMAMELEICISAAAKGGDLDSEDVAFMGALCTTALFP